MAGYSHIIPAPNLPSTLTFRCEEIQGNKITLQYVPFVWHLVQVDFRYYLRPFWLLVFQRILLLLKKRVYCSFLFFLAFSNPFDVHFSDSVFIPSIIPLRFVAPNIEMHVLIIQALFLKKFVCFCSWFRNCIASLNYELAGHSHHQILSITEWLSLATCERKSVGSNLGPKSQSWQRCLIL